MNKKWFGLGLVFASSLTFADLYKIAASMPTYQSQEIPSSSSTSDDDSDELRIVTRGISAKVAAAQTTRFILTGGSLPIHKREELKGNKIEDITDRSTLITPRYELERRISAYEKKMDEKYADLNKQTSFMYNSFKPILPYWSLVYDSSDKTLKNAYVLNFGINMVHLRPTKKNEFSRIGWSEACTFTSQPMTLETWKANDYEAVKQTKSLILDECEKKFTQKIDKGIEQYLEIVEFNKKFEDDPTPQENNS